MDPAAAPVDGTTRFVIRPGTAAALAARPVVRRGKIKADEIVVEDGAGNTEKGANGLDTETRADHSGKHAVERTNDGGRDREQ